ncbi:hypothetical protein SGL43_06453 [Streptomyces globisporus]|uniref:Uncharacterized protein n=1 Tax=Streptomyces globisporus TaxID=1908 RepID=A0ABM9H6Z2_STRGL|nr:hypothetical protein SGL43_06453 [Streptomyces globisporus]
MAARRLGRAGRGCRWCASDLRCGAERRAERPGACRGPPRRGGAVGREPFLQR